MGETLFDRAARDGSLTAAGVLLRDYALRLLALRREATSALGELKSLERGHLQLAANEYTCMYLLPAIDAFRREFPQISVTVHRMLASRIPEELNLRTFRAGRDFLQARSGAVSHHCCLWRQPGVDREPAAIRWQARARSRSTSWARSCLWLTMWLRRCGAR